MRQMGALIWVLFVAVVTVVLERDCFFSFPDVIIQRMSPV